MDYAQKKALLGLAPTKLDEGFVDEDRQFHGQKKPSVYINRRASARVTAPPLPDLTHLNPPGTRRAIDCAREWWAKLTPEDRRAEHAKRRAIGAVRKASRQS